MLNRLNKIGRLLLEYPKIGKSASSYLRAIEVGARFLEGSQLLYRPDRCVGCGLCVTSCKSQAITMERHAKGGHKKPLYPLDS